MQIFKDIKAALGSNREQVPPTILVFPTLDKEQIARKLSLEERAREAGMHEQPPGDATASDRSEHDCLAEIEQRAQKSLQEYHSQLELYDARIRRAAVSVDQRVMIEAAGRGALSDFDALTIDDLNHLHLIKQEVEGRHAELEDFRRVHQLRRMPNTVSVREKLFRSIIVAILIVLESLINGSMFASGSEAGLIGGISQALVLSLLNVGSALLFGFFVLPQLVHRSIARRLLGAAALPVYLIAVLAINLFIAHFRDAFIAHAGQVDMPSLLDQLARHPFVLADANSLVLCALGIGLNIVALIDTIGFDDLYWGYAQVGRRYKEASARFAAEKSHSLDGLMGRRDAAINHMADLINTLRSLEYDAELALQGRTRLHADFTAHLDHLAAAYESLILHYREANERARQTPPPAYFRRSPGRPAFLQAPALPGPPPFDTSERRLAIQRMEHYIEAINTEYSRRIGEYDTLAALTARAVPQHAPA